MTQPHPQYKILSRAQAARMADRLEAVLHQKGMTNQSALARRSGVPQSSISDLLGRKYRSVSSRHELKLLLTYRKLAAALDLPTHYFEGVPQPPRSFGQAVKQSRLALGWTELELARNARITGAYISQIERGLVAPPHISEAVFERLCDTLGIEPQRWNQPYEEDAHG